MPCSLCKQQFRLLHNSIITAQASLALNGGGKRNLIPFPFILHYIGDSVIEKQRKQNALRYFVTYFIRGMD